MAGIFHGRTCYVKYVVVNCYWIYTAYPQLCSTVSPSRSSGRSIGAVRVENVGSDPIESADYLQAMGVLGEEGYTVDYAPARERPGGSSNLLYPLSVRATSEFFHQCPSRLGIRKLS
jgi:hypothetical protein